MPMSGPQGQAVEIVNNFVTNDGTLDGCARFALAQGSPTTFQLDMKQFGDKSRAVAVVAAFISAGFVCVSKGFAIAGGK
jgi:hypothetical protein